MELHQEGSAINAATPSSWLCPCHAVLWNPSSHFRILHNPQHHLDIAYFDASSPDGAYIAAAP